MTPRELADYLRACPVVVDGLPLRDAVRHLSQTAILRALTDTAVWGEAYAKPRTACDPLDVWDAFAAAGEFETLPDGVLLRLTPLLPDRAVPLTDPRLDRTMRRVLNGYGGLIDAWESLKTQPASFAEYHGLGREDMFAAIDLLKTS